MERRFSDSNLNWKTFAEILTECSSRHAGANWEGTESIELDGEKASKSTDSIPSIPRFLGLKILYWKLIVEG